MREIYLISIFFAIGTRFGQQTTTSIESIASTRIEKEHIRHAQATVACSMEADASKIFLVACENRRSIDDV